MIKNHFAAFAVTSISQNFRGDFQKVVFSRIQQYLLKFLFGTTASKVTLPQVTVSVLIPTKLPQTYFDDLLGHTLYINRQIQVPC